LTRLSSTSNIRRPLQGCLLVSLKINSMG